MQIHKIALKSPPSTKFCKIASRFSQLFTTFYKSLVKSPSVLHLVVPDVPRPTLSLGMSLSSDPCLRKTFPAVCCGLIPMPSSVMMAEVEGSACELRGEEEEGVTQGAFRLLCMDFFGPFPENIFKRWRKMHANFLRV
jgi:hypothetical protein